MAVSGLPSLEVILKCAFIAFTATCCHFLLFMATMRTSAASVAPLVYIQLIISGVISVYIFDDPLDPIAIVGAVLILASGLLLWRSEKKAENGAGSLGNGFGQYGQTGLIHLGKTALDRDRFRSSPFAGINDQNPHRECGHHWCVIGQDTEIAFRAGNNHHEYIIRTDEFFRG